MIDPARMREAFGALSGRELRLFAAPGRVNLIGEHTDYNDGFVLPVALDRYTVVAAAARTDRCIRVRSVNTGETVSVDLSAAPVRRRGVWLDYVEGVARCIEARGTMLGGADLLLESDVPEGAGLSSSAALEVAVGFALESLAGRDVDLVSLALAAQRAEHEYVGTNVGIMDQFISALGEEGHALLIDCRALSATAIPIETSRADIVICDTRVKHSLATSAYNTRRQECERGVALLRKALPEITALRDVTMEQFEALEATLPDPIGRRCRHVIGENARTLSAAEALRTGDLEHMGALMAASHRSLRDDYEVSCAELDALVTIAADCKDVYGARMTGGGFGGCTVNFVRRGAHKTFLEQVTRQYYDVMHLEPAVYVTRPARGAHELI